MDETCKQMPEPSSKTGGLEGLLALRRKELGETEPQGTMGRSQESQDAFNAGRCPTRVEDTLGAGSGAEGSEKLAEEAPEWS